MHHIYYKKDFIIYLLYYILLLPSHPFLILRNILHKLLLHQPNSYTFTFPQPVGTHKKKKIKISPTPKRKKKKIPQTLPTEPPPPPHQWKLPFPPTVGGDGGTQSPFFLFYNPSLTPTNCLKKSLTHVGLKIASSTPRRFFKWPHQCHRSKGIFQNLPGYL